MKLAYNINKNKKNKVDVHIIICTRDKYGDDIFGVAEEIKTLKALAKRMRKGRHIYHKYVDKPITKRTGIQIYKTHYYMIIPSITSYQKQIIRDLGFTIINASGNYKALTNEYKYTLNYKKYRWKGFSMDTSKREMVS